eukprot:TRINITY_DN8584_c0_g1_i1.p1 TRINITY_DN8584_c0_g1~~TRINITY_DN8584_c0_g1_i1.p1  ORF type:complete len:913 (-),score=94.09 TRINITY_DN8584_c0_g1_i1:62-2800(-)
MRCRSGAMLRRRNSTLSANKSALIVYFGWSLSLLQSSCQASTLEAAYLQDDECALDTACAISAIQLQSQQRAVATAGQVDKATIDYFGQLRWTNHPSMCLDVTDGLARNGNLLQLWSCLSSSQNQQFTWSSHDGKLRWAANPEFCVDVKDHGNFNGNRLQLWKCMASNSDQSFLFPSSGRGHIRWQNHPEKCVDVRDHNPTNGNSIQIWSCIPSNSDQDFSFTTQDPAPAPTPLPTPLDVPAGKDGGGSVSFLGQIGWSNHPSKCLDVHDGMAQNGNHVQIWSCISSSQNQQFVWSNTDGQIRWAAHPEFCIDVKDHGNFNGNRIQIWKCSNSNADQSFSISPSGQGRISWKSHPDKCVDVRDHSSTNGNYLQIWSCDAANSDQDFSLKLQNAAQPQPTPEPTKPQTDSSSEFDVIVVGAGLVGSAVAARVAAKLPASHKVLLLEAGRASHRSLGGTDPPASWTGSRWETWPGMQNEPLTRYDVPGNYEVLQCWGRNCPESWGDTVPFFQCKVLGGCGVMNGALVQLPQQENFARWPLGWRGPDLAPYFDAAQSLYHITEAPSSDGEHYLDQAGADFVRRAFAKAGVATSSSLLEKAKTMSIPRVTAAHGVRQSTASQLLPQALKQPNFELRLETEVDEILHEGSRVTGVRVRRADGSLEVLRLKRQGLLILSAGAMNTPRLLLASGITANGQVGKYLSDHPLKSMVYKTTGSPGAYPQGATESFGVKPPRSNDVRQYAKSQSGPLAQYGPTLTAFIRDPSTPGGPEAYDVEVWVNPVGKEGELHVSLALMRPTCSKATLSLNGRRLQSTGQLYLGCSRDRQTMNFALSRVDRWLGKQGAKRIHISEARSLNHWAGTCALGRCVDPKSLRVQGMENLAIADASILPGQIWGHPALALTAVALKAADDLVASM